MSKITAAVNLKIRIYDMCRELFRANEKLEKEIAIREKELNILKVKRQEQTLVIEESCKQYGFKIEKVEVLSGFFKEKLVPSKEVKDALF